MVQNRSKWYREVLVVALFLLAAAAAEAKNQGWVNNSITLGVTDHIGVKFSRESRFGKTSDLGQPILKNLQIGVAVTLPAGLKAGFAYKRESEEKSSFVSSENRYVGEASFGKKVFNVLRPDVRVRFEQRTYEQAGLEEHLRYRLRLRIKGDIQISKLALSPFIATELFGDTKRTTEDFLNRNRFFIGTEIPVHKSVKLVINYIRQDTIDKESINILNTGVDLKF